MHAEDIHLRPMSAEELGLWFQQNPKRLPEPRSFARQNLFWRMLIFVGKICRAVISLGPS